jgi:hypothetical protein
LWRRQRMWPATRVQRLQRAACLSDDGREADSKSVRVGNCEIAQTVIPI